MNWKGLPKQETIRDVLFVIPFLSQSLPIKPVSWSTPKGWGLFLPLRKLLGPGFFAHRVAEKWPTFARLGLPAMDTPTWTKSVQRATVQKPKGMIRCPCKCLQAMVSTMFSKCRGISSISSMTEVNHPPRCEVDVVDCTCAFHDLIKTQLKAVNLLAVLAD